MQDWAQEKLQYANTARLPAPATTLRPCVSHLAVSLEGQDVGSHAVQEPAVVADEQCGAREIQDGLLQAAARRWRC